MFKNLTDDLVSIANDRMDNAVSCLGYDIEYLDNATGGIFKHDLVIIGGRTGAGKTELASIIAQNNARKGKRVFYYALEAEEDEITNRLLYRLFSRIYYPRIYERTNKPLNYLSFMKGDYDRKYPQEVEEAEAILRTEFTTLNVFYRDKTFTLDDFVKSVQDYFMEADLFILDHIHHFDFDSSLTELAQLKSAVKTLRDTCLIFGKPIIVIAHLRKGDRQSKQIIPDLEEFYGSSEISKEATQVITIAPYDMQEDQEPYIYPTLFKICKHRKYGGITKFIGLQAYNSQTNKYDPKVILGKLVKSGTEFEPIVTNKPHWSED